MGRALLLAAIDVAANAGPSSIAYASLLAQFLDAAALAPTALMPLQIYATPAADGDAAIARAAAAVASAPSQGGPAAVLRARQRLTQRSPTPAFKLVLKPRFAPWPLEMQLSEVTRWLEIDRD